LGVLYILFASPTAVSSYIMAKAMKNDSNLAANIVLISTLGSILTIFLGVFTMKSIGWIP
jgi:predicted permease